MSSYFSVDDFAWWRGDKGNVHEQVVSSFKQIDGEQTYNATRDLHHLRLYSNFAATSMTGTGYAMSTGDARMKQNVVKAVVDTATSRIGTVRPRPLFLTERGNWSLQAKAKALSKFVLGLFHHLGQYEVGLKVFKDACIFGLGIQHVTHVNGEIAIERVLPNEILVDDVEAKYGHPRQMFRHKEVAPERLAALYPKFKEEILASTYIRDEGFAWSYEKSFKPISWIEGWKLPSYPGAGDGRHVVVTSKATLVDEPWDRDDFPFVFFRWSERPLGFYGTGLAEELSDVQLELNFLLGKIQRLMTLATSQIWVQEGSVNKNVFSNDDFAVREYRGQPPLFMPVQSVSPEYFAQIDRYWGRAFEVAGISQLSSTGRKPSGLNSGAALREHQDIESLRFLDVQQRWEGYYIELAKKLVREARYLDEHMEGGFKLNAPGDRGLERLDFSKISLDEDKYQLQVYPTSLLPKTPAGKLQTIQELGQISPEIQKVMLSQLDFPDIEGAVSMINAPIEMADQIIEDILMKGNYRPPEPFFDLQAMISRFSLALIRADVDGAPEGRLELLRRFITEADALLNPPQPPAPAPQPAPGAAPGPEPAGALPLEMAALAGQPGALPTPAPGGPPAAVAGALA